MKQDEVINPGLQIQNSGESEAQGHSQLPSESGASLSYMRTCLETISLLYVHIKLLRALGASALATASCDALTGTVIPSIPTMLNKTPFRSG